MINEKQLTTYAEAKGVGVLIYHAMIGQYFVDTGGKITSQKCWVLICGLDTRNGEQTEDDAEDYADWDEMDLSDTEFDDCEDTAWEDEDCEATFAIPVLPYKREREQFVRQRENCKIDAGQLIHQNEVFTIAGDEVSLNIFLKNMPEFAADTPLEEVFRLMNRALRPSELFLDGDEGEPFQKHLYLTATNERQLFCLDFDDNCYRPMVWAIPVDLDGTTRYLNFASAMQYGRKVGEVGVDKLFRQIRIREIELLNQGLDNARREGRLRPNSRIDKAFPHIEEITLVPSFWKHSNGEVAVRYDLLLDWRDGVREDGGVYASFGDFVAWHRPAEGDEGQLGLQVDAKVILS